MIPFFQTGPTILAAVYLLTLGLAIGFPLTRLFEADARARLLIAAPVGLGLVGVVGALVFHVVPFSLGGVAVVVALAGAIAVLLGRGAAAPLFHTRQTASPLWVVAALMLAFVPAFANMPHVGAAGVVLGETVFDHAKVAIVDEIARNGLPAHNPFYQQAGSANLLNYYYLWYLLAATAEPVTGARGWEADVALTGVTAFMSLLSLGWAAMACGRRPAAAWWVIAISGTATLRFLVILLVGDRRRTVLTGEHRLEPWLEQASWVPQHLFAATLAILAIFGLVALLRRDILTPGSAVIVAVLIAASYDSSIWIGGFGLAAILPVLALIGLATQARTARPATLANLAIVAGVALGLSAVFLIRNLSVLGHRHTIDVRMYPILVGAGDSFGLRVANALAFWLFLLAADFGFAYLVTVAWCSRLRRLWAETHDLVHPALALAFVIPLLLAQLLVSVIANNDLGWRIVLIAVFAMTIVAAAWAARLMGTAARRWILAVAVLCLLPGIISGIALGLRFDGITAFAGTKVDARFADQPALWRAVRAVTPADQAVLDNPDSLAAMTRWPAHIGWALLSDRRSCAAGFLWLRSLAPDLLPDDLRRLDDRIDRVFGGRASTEDFRVLKEENLCRTLVVVPTDPLWASPMTANPYYTLVDSAEGRWRLYR